ncbi:unnamed protein product, partial [Discosporangium mesarthrocarpum]
RNTLRAIGEDPLLDLVLHAGDLSYADCDQSRWDSFMRMLDPVASRLPWMVAAGNHEIENGGMGGRPFQAYEARFTMPATAPAVQGLGCGAGGGLDGKGGAQSCGMGRPDEDEEGDMGLWGVEEEVGDARGEQAGAVEGKGERVYCCPSEWSGTYDFGNSFYSFDVGPVHVVVINPYTASGKDSIQYKWLAEDLDAADRLLTPWLLVMMHCPWYNTNRLHQLERQALTAMSAMEPLLIRHRVALVIAGHVH